MPGPTSAGRGRSYTRPRGQGSVPSGGERIPAPEASGTSPQPPVIIRVS